MKKDIEITNFGKQLKNALRDHEASSQSKSAKLKKQVKKTGKQNVSKQTKFKDQLRTFSEKEIIEFPLETSIANLNESNITELSTPVCISVKTHFFNQPYAKPQLEVKSKPILEVKSKPTQKQSNDLPPQPKTITTQVLNRNPGLKNKHIVNSEKPASSFNYQPAKTTDKFIPQGSNENTGENGKFLFKYLV
jgi:hypothetical protein